MLNFFFARNNNSLSKPSSAPASPQSPTPPPPQFFFRFTTIVSDIFCSLLEMNDRYSSCWSSLASLT